MKGRGPRHHQAVAPSPGFGDSQGALETEAPGSTGDDNRTAFPAAHDVLLGYWLICITACCRLEGSRVGLSDDEFEDRDDPVGAGLVLGEVRYSGGLSRIDLVALAPVDLDSCG